MLFGCLCLLVFEGECEIPQMPACDVAFFESFGSHKAESYWHPSDAENYTGAWQIEKTVPPRMRANEMALVTKSKSSYSAVSTKFSTPIDNKNKDLVLQYEMRPQMAFTCAGAYIKLFRDPDFSPSKLTNETEHIMMFGPDKCGPKNAVQFIYHHQHPIRNLFLEKVATNPPKAPNDLLTHLYTLVVRKNNTYSILIDNVEKSRGSLYFDVEPRLLEPREFTDKKPSDYNDRDEWIVDKQDKKPADWDENTEWKPRAIRNPNYQKEWKPTVTRNPYYFMDMHPSDFEPFTGIGFELWAVNRELAFSNVLIAHDEAAVREWNQRNFLVRQKIQMEKAETGEDGSDVDNGFYRELGKAYHEIRLALLEIYRQYPVPTSLLLASPVVFVLLVLARISCRNKQKEE